MSYLPTDVIALVGIALVLCAAVLHLMAAQHARRRWALTAAVAVFAALWWPAGESGLPLVAYVRGFCADLSVTLVLLACLKLSQYGLGVPAFFADRDKSGLFVAVAVVAVFFYPLALGWGDWDPYRLGWGSPGLWLALMFVSVAAWLAGFRLLPLAVALALLAWTAGLLESTNLWDYLLDPWLSIIAMAHVALSAIRAGGAWHGRTSRLRTSS